MNKINNQSMLPIVVKIQQSVYSSDGIKKILIVNKDRSIISHQSEPNAVKELLAHLKQRDKAYFRVQLSANQINILEELTPQPW